MERRKKISLWGNILGEWKFKKTYFGKGVPKNLFPKDYFQQRVRNLSPKKGRGEHI